MSLLLLFVCVAALHLSPILVPLFAAALILPRNWLCSYAALAVAAIVILSDYSDAHDDGAFAGLGAFLFRILATAALVAGLIARCAMGEVRRPGPKPRQPG